MIQFLQRKLWCIAFALLTASLAAAQGAPPDSLRAEHDGAADVKATIKSVDLGAWRYNGFEAIDASNGVADRQQTPWSPFLDPAKGYVALFINPAADMANTGKGGNAGGTRHPQLSLWIFPKTAENTPEHFQESIQQHQMVQSSIPVVIGASNTYVLVCVGDVDEARSQVAALAKAFKVNATGAH